MLQELGPQNCNKKFYKTQKHANHLVTILVITLKIVSQENNHEIKKIEMEVVGTGEITPSRTLCKKLHYEMHHTRTKAIKYLIIIIAVHCKQCCQPFRRVLLNLSGVCQTVESDSCTESPATDMIGIGQNCLNCSLHCTLI
jgi:hypothetical protein